MTRNQIAALALVVVAGLVFWEARGLSFGTFASPGSGYWPFTLATMLLAFSLPVVVFGGNVDGIGERTTLWKVLAVPSCVGFVLIAMETLGYRATVAIAVIFLLGTVEGRHPAITFAAAVLLAFGSWYVLEQGLGVRLPHGFWRF